MTGGEVLLSARGLSVSFPGRRTFGQTAAGAVQALSGVDLDLFAGETLALVGESGSGKSTFARVAMGLVPPSDGSLRFAGREMDIRDPQASRALRRRLQMVFQDPFASLNPTLTVGASVAEPLIIHGLARGLALKAKVAACLESVGLDPAVAGRRPSEFSGGQRQRICIARAIACEPDLIIADEALSALDKSLAGQILALLRDLKQRRSLTYLFISHDLNVVQAFADRVAVMYLGRVVELAATSELFADPKHPYSQALLAAAPVADPAVERRRVYHPLPGAPPSPANPPSGCHFHNRCPAAVDVCRTIAPPLRTIAPGRRAACHLAQ